MPFAMRYSATPLRKLSSFQMLSSAWTAAISVIRLASSICPTFTLQRPIDAIRPSRFREASARTLVASGVRGSGAWS